MDICCPPAWLRPIPSCLSYLMALLLLSGQGQPSWPWLSVLLPWLNLDSVTGVVLRSQITGRSLRRCGAVQHTQNQINTTRTGYGLARMRLSCAWGEARAGRSNCCGKLLQSTVWYRICINRPSRGRRWLEVTVAVTSLISSPTSAAVDPRLSDGKAHAGIVPAGPPAGCWDML